MNEPKGIFTKGPGISIEGFRGDWEEPGVQNALKIMLGTLISRRDQCDDVVVLTFSLQPPKDGPGDPSTP